MKTTTDTDHCQPEAMISWLFRYTSHTPAELPDVGLMKVRDAETGHEQWIDTSSRALRRAT